MKNSRTNPGQMQNMGQIPGLSRISRTNCQIPGFPGFPGRVATMLVLQKRAMRLMTYNDQYPVIPGPLSPSHPIFIKLELLKIEEIFKYYISKFIFKCLLQLTPINFHSWFTASSAIHNYRTRSNFNIEFNPMTCPTG